VDTKVWAFHVDAESVDDERRVFELSESDYRSWWLDDKSERVGSPWVSVTDLVTGDRVQIAWASCGLGCHCSAVWR